MQKGSQLSFHCLECNHELSFSPLSLSSGKNIVCSECETEYALGDENLKRQLLQFETLCNALIASEEILSNCSIGIDIGEKKLKIPYKLLLTRFNSLLELEVGDKKLTIEFRLEPLKDLSIH